MTQITNISFNKHTISWELIHIILLNHSVSVMKSMYRHQIITVLPKHCPKKTNKPPQKICYKSNMMTFPKGTIFETTNRQPGELIHTEFELYNVTSTQGFISMLTIVCENTRIIWVFTTASKIPPV